MLVMQAYNFIYVKYAASQISDLWPLKRSEVSFVIMSQVLPSYCQPMIPNIYAIIINHIHLKLSL